MRYFLGISVYITTKNATPAVYEFATREEADKFLKRIREYWGSNALAYIVRVTPKIILNSRGEQ